MLGACDHLSLGDGPAPPASKAGHATPAARLLAPVDRYACSKAMVPPANELPGAATPVPLLGPHWLEPHWLALVQQPYLNAGNPRQSNRPRSAVHPAPYAHGDTSCTVSVIDAVSVIDPEEGGNGDPTADGSVGATTALLRRAQLLRMAANKASPRVHQTKVAFRLENKPGETAVLAGRGHQGSASARSRPAQSLRWHIERLRSMPPPELAYRAAEKTRQTTYRWRPPRPALGAAGCLSPRVDLTDWILAYGDGPAIRQYWRERADAVRGGLVEALGATWALTSNGTPDWQRDPVTGHRWPQTYCFDVDYRHGTTKLGDVKYVWELNRLQYLLPIAAYAATAGDANAAGLCKRHVRDWVERTPPRCGVAWSSGIELATRSVTMVAVAQLVRRQWPDPDFEQLVADSVRIQLDWMARFPSRYSSANNHRIAESAGMFLVAVACPGLLSASRMTAVRGDLECQALRQIHPDGVSAEQAVGYGRYVLEWLATCARVASAIGQPLHPEVLDRLERAGDALGALTDCRGNLMHFGDEDESRLLTAALPEQTTVPAVRALAGSWGAPPAGVTSLAAGGYTVCREQEGGQETLWVLDHGPLGFAHLAAHAHADSLAVWLHRAGRPVLVDAGTYLYHAGGDWRDYLRGTTAHNTLTVAGLHSSTVSGPFNWRPSQRAHGRLVRLLLEGGTWTVDAEHDGYVSRLGVTHRRRLTRIGICRYQLVDSLSSRKSHEVTWSVLVAPHLDVWCEADGWSLVDGKEPVARIVVFGPGLRLRAKRGREEPRAGWCSRGFGSLESAWQLLAEGELGPGEELITQVLLSPDRA